MLGIATDFFCPALLHRHTFKIQNAATHLMLLPESYLWIPFTRGIIPSRGPVRPDVQNQCRMTAAIFCESISDVSSRISMNPQNQRTGVALTDCYFRRSAVVNGNVPVTADIT